MKMRKVIFVSDGELLDISLRPLCTSTPNFKEKLKKKYKRLSTNQSLRRQALRKSLINKPAQSPNKSLLLTNSPYNRKKRTQRKLPVSPIAAAPHSGSGTDEGESVARETVAKAQPILHNDSSSDSDCCVVEDTRPGNRKLQAYVPITRKLPPPGQIIDLDSDSSEEEGEIVDTENQDQTNILFFEDKNGSYAMTTPMYKTPAVAEESQVSLVRSPSIICLDDDVKAEPSKLKAEQHKPEPGVGPVTKRFEKFTTNETADNSILFMGEVRRKKPTLSEPAPDFIRLEEVPVPIQKKSSLNFVAARKEVRDAVNKHKKPPEKAKNWINPAAMQSEKRLIVIDGNNVCHLKTAVGFFSVKRLETIIKYFESRSHEVKVVVPEYRLNPFRSSDHQRMQQLFEDGKIVKTPCKRFKDKKVETIYDDRVMLQIAVEIDGVVISGDNFRDITGEDKARDKIIAERVIAPIWVTDDMVMMPEDPYGRFGPKLKDILHRIVTPRKPKK